MNDKRKNKKIKKLIAFCSISSFIFIVATYAWFIGMRQVNVSSFEIEIASTDSLLLSLDGSKWDTTVTINSSNFQTVSYANNVNNWAGYDSTKAETGLKPISSIGEIDTATSTMKMFEKGSLTATTGGYRLLASRIHNNDDTNTAGFYKEKGGYVAFDLFVRNFSGQAYYKEDNVNNEEAIYLTTDSYVSAPTTGANITGENPVGVAGAGIENSVRVGFAQIGRVNGKTTDVATITGMKCLPDGEHKVSDNSDVTGICRTAQIWEPNDTAHVAAAISYYNTSCRKRINPQDTTDNPTDITLASAYSSDTCTLPVDGTASKTYAIGRVVNIADKVDVYDGATFNGYTGTTRATYNGSEPLYEFDYFTDTERDLTRMDRPAFMTLAPNSITKIRVYVWLEGQDIDNYDFASIGKQIRVAFGFTKERFTEEEAQGVNGPNMPTGDSTKPIITGVASETTSLNSAAAVSTYNPMTGVHAYDPTGVKEGTFATAEACTAANGLWLDLDNDSTSECYDYDDLTTKIQVTNPVIAKNGNYVVRYLVSDWQGNYAEAAANVTVSGISGE